MAGQKILAHALEIKASHDASEWADYDDGYSNYANYVDTYSNYNDYADAQGGTNQDDNDADDD